MKKPQKNSMHSVTDVSVDALTKPNKLIFDMLVRESFFICRRELWKKSDRN